jgi:hypothetical protein
MGQSPDGKNVSTETKDILGIHNQATTGEDTAGKKYLLRTADCVK